MAEAGETGALPSLSSTSSQRILRSVNQLFATGLSGDAPGSVGLTKIAEDPAIRIRIPSPRQKVSVMIIGNHSAGKSSFINWYIGDEIQRTGVAMETRGFTLITSGKRRETLGGDATLKYFEHLESLGASEDIKNSLSTEVSSSKSRSFDCVDFIDTPGLVDGDMQYAFNALDVTVALADHADLILVFLDPIGQATCRRCMAAVERLSSGRNAEKLKFFLSKADEVPDETDRQKVLIQITQNLAAHVRGRSHAFDLPTFYLPAAEGSAAGPSIPNAIGDVCDVIDKAISHTVQKNLGKLTADCRKLIVAIDTTLAVDLDHQAQNRASRNQGIILSIMAYFMLGWIAWVSVEEAISTTSGRAFVAALPDPFYNRIMAAMPNSTRAQHGPAVMGLIREGFLLAVFVMFAMFLILRLSASVIWTSKPVLKPGDVGRLLGYKQVVIEIGNQESAVLYKQFFGSITPEGGGS